MSTTTSRTTLLDALNQLRAAGAVDVSSNATTQDIDDEIAEVRHADDDGHDYAVIDMAVFRVRDDGVIESVPVYEGLDHEDAE